MQVLPTEGSSRLELVNMKAKAHEIVITLKMTVPTAQCPSCQQWSSYIHSRYFRRLADLPWGSVPVRIDLQVRRFRCSTPNCHHHYFTERVPEIAPPYRRRTNRFQDWLSVIALALGGEPTARVFRHLGLQVSADTCLRLIRQTTNSAYVTPRVLGIDDWARCKGRTYGTILCDLERHSVIELLPDREAKTVSSWLEAHPGVEIICRDRASAYAEAAQLSAPNAQQVADRFHLLMNLTETVKKTVERNRQCLRLPVTDLPLPTVSNATHSSITTAPSKSDDTVSSTAQPEIPQNGASLTPRQQLVAERRARRRDKYNKVVELHHLGVSERKIAKQLGISRPTVERYLRVGHYPEHARTGETIRPYADYLIQRWQTGATIAIQLFEEIKKQGYHGSYKAVTMFVTELKRGSVQTISREAVSDSSPPTTQPKFRSVAPRHVAYLLTAPTTDLAAERQQEVDWLCRSFPDLDASYHLAQEFGKIVRERLPDQFDPWLEKASKSSLTDFRNFAKSLIKDKNAVSAALATSWSSGQVEGQVNRLKLIKREMFGRGKLDLLQKRLCYSAA